MNRLHQWLNNRNLKILGISSGIVLGLPLISATALAQWHNPRYEYDQYNRRQMPHQQMPNRQMPQRPMNQSTPTSTPLPNNEIKADATINPSGETIDIQLQNQTNVPVSYQVIGHTDFITIEGGREIMLRNIPLPATVGLVREDDGMLKVMPMSSDSDMLNVILEEDKYFDDVQGTLRIQEDGQVFVY